MVAPGLVVRDGMLDLPAGPGLGVTLDWDWITKNRVGHAVYE